MRDFQLPLSESDVRSLHTGEYVRISGRLLTARDAVHKFLHDGGVPPCDFHGAVIYHCGPVVVNEGGKWHVNAAGPTTSIREEPYMAGLIERFHIRAVVGKGGMGPDTLEACRRHGCVYLHAIGGAAQTLASSVIDVPAVYGYEQFGAPEAIWELTVRDFPALVTMDTHGVNLGDEVKKQSLLRLHELLLHQ